jgi:hypothetical protein
MGRDWLNRKAECSNCLEGEVQHMQKLPIIYNADLIGGNQTWHLITTILNYVQDQGMEISKELQTEVVIVGEKDNRRN